uniref:Cystinosin homolog n=1 Tax=Brassica oleracea var. oleracea TaxID=109376 RepID=A0A0D3CIV9_BRAOL
MFTSLSAPSSLPSSLAFSLVSVKSHPAAGHIVPRRDLVSLRIRASKNGSSDYCFHEKLKSFAKSAILIGAAVSMTGKLSTLPAKAGYPVTTTVEVKEEKNSSEIEPTSPLTELLESTPEAVKTLRSLLQQKLENGEDEEALKLLEKLVTAQPEETEWKFLMARLLGEMGRTENARQVFEEILQRNPLSFEALFENALLMDRSGEGDAVLQRLEDALAVAEAENMVKEIRDVRLIIAQIQFLQKNVDEALKSYEQLTREDPKDFRPYFCRGMIYSLLDKNAEAKEQFAKYRELSPKKFEVEGFVHLICAIFFCCHCVPSWSISFYPQLILNFRRKSVVGLNFDFVLLNLTKHSSYMIYNACLYFSPIIQKQYFDTYGDQEVMIHVAANDVAFSIHAVVLTALTLFQIFIYERGPQKVSRFATGLVVLVWGFAAICFFIALPSHSWLWLITIFNSIQVSMTCVKYIPQSHLCPLPLMVQPIIWNYDHSLRLYPTPHTVYS